MQYSLSLKEETFPKPLRRQQASTVDLSSKRLISTGITGGIILIIITILLTRSLLLLVLLLLFPLLVTLGYSVKFLYKKWTEAKVYDPEAQDYDQDYDSEVQDYNSEAEDSREVEKADVQVTTV